MAEEREQIQAQDEEESAKKLVGEVNKKFTDWREVRRPHETTWFTNSAFSRGQQNFNPHPLFRGKMLPDSDEPIQKVKPSINRIFPKTRARFAKFTKSRPQPIVIPFTSERKRKLDAKATQRALDYLWEKEKLEVKYREALLWAKDCHKGFWAIRWNPNKTVPVKITNPITQTVSIEDAELGDVEIEAFSPFELLVADPKKARLSDQPEIMRVRAMDVKDIELRYPDLEGKIKPDAGPTDLFQFERQIASLNAKSFGITASVSEYSDEKTHAILKELFTKPSARYPKGRYVVVCGDQLCKKQDELPYDFGDMENPYPIIEFIDLPTVGQFWGTTIVEQLVPIQRAYNGMRYKLDRHLHKMVHNKWMVPKQAQIPEGSFTNDADEVVEWNFIPGMPEPHQVQAPPISSDVWRALQVFREEMDDVSQIFPAAEGRVGKETSGFHASLLQEAVDEVMSPEARGHELAIEDAALKIRRLMKIGYTVPRLVSVVGRNHSSEVFEFHSGQIDEHATLKVQVGSGLSGFKATRITQILELYDKGVLGDQNDPEVKRRVLTMLDMGGLEEAQEVAARHEELARLENDEIFDGKPLPIPEFYENHAIHYAIHTDQLSSPETRDWPEDRRTNLMKHTLLHFKFIDPISAFNLAVEKQFDDIIGPGLIPVPQPEAPMPPQGGEQAPPQGAPAAPAVAPAPPMMGMEPPVMDSTPTPQGV